VPGTIHRRWLQRLAESMRRLAAFLERLSSSASPDPAIQQLEAQFPNAPKHWLEYVAARAPHVAMPATEMPNSESMPDNGANARAAPRKPTQARSENAMRRPILLSLLDASNGTYAEISPNRKPGERRRPRLWLLSSSEPDRRRNNSVHPGFVKRTPANEVKQQAAEPRESGTELRKTQPSLQLAPHDSRTATALKLSATGQGGKEARRLRFVASILTAFSGKRACPADEERRRDAEAQLALPQNRTSSRATALSSQLAVSRVPLAVPKRLAAVADSTTSGNHRLIVQASRELRRDTARAAGVPESADTPDLRWPALPALDGSLPDARIRPPDFSQLCREQEEGLWNA
jgi:hypothetical protein